MKNTLAPVCVVDDDASIREAVGGLIRSAGWKARTFKSANEFLTGRRPAASCLVLDVELPGLSGLDLQQQLVKEETQIPIIFLTGRGDIPMSVRAIKRGALEFLTKPFDDEQLLTAIRQAIAQSPTKHSQGRNGQKQDCAGIVGASASLKAVLHQIEKVAPTESTVLVLGETGTGKELAGRAIHNRSQRRSRPFVSVNCAAIPPTLIASELFGHEKGAFTGAQQRRAGRFELAEGGTIFLDEVGDLPAEAQALLLRVLQEKEFERVGGNETIAADVRVIAATNRDLPTQSAAGTFRSDLFYRLNVFPIEMPPLRKRTEDIPMLVDYFIRRHAPKTGKEIRRINQKSLEDLRAYSWPGNIRELQNVIERSLICCDTEEFSVDENWLAEIAGTATTLSRTAAVGPATSEKERIEAALAETRGRVYGPAGAAAKLCLPHSTLESKIRSLGINKYSFKIA
jgi:DNA-binding NtrC family response regulator